MPFRSHASGFIDVESISTFRNHLCVSLKVCIPVGVYLMDVTQATSRHRTDHLIERMSPAE